MFNKKILINLNCLRVVEIQNTFEGNTCKNRRELKYITFEGKLLKVSFWVAASA